MGTDDAALAASCDERVAAMGPKAEDVCFRDTE